MAICARHSQKEGLHLLWLAEKHLLHQVREKSTLVSLEFLKQIVGVRLPLPSKCRQLHARPPALQVCVHCLDFSLGKPKVHHVSEKSGHLLTRGTQLLGTYLQDLCLSTQPGKGKGRVSPCRDDHTECGRQVLNQ